MKIFISQEKLQGDQEQMTILLEICSRSVGLDHPAALLLDSAGEWELDLGVMHLLDQRTTTFACCNWLTPDDLDTVGPGSVSSSHVPAMRKNIRDQLKQVERKVHSGPKNVPYS